MMLVSYVEEKYQNELENLVFFNEHQLKYLNHITKAINDFGIPKLTKTSKGISIIIEGLPELQTIFFLDDNNEQLIGFSLLYRENTDTFTLLHIGINSKFTSINNTKDIYLFRIINEIMKMVSHIKNIHFLKILYCDGIKCLRVRK